MIKLNKRATAQKMKFSIKDLLSKCIVYRKTDGLEVDCYVLLFLKVC